MTASLKFWRASDVPLGRLHRRVAKQKLNLFQFASGAVAEASTSAAKIVRCEMVKADLPGVSFHRAPRPR